MRASSLPLLLKCPGSATLPQDHTKSDEAIKGSEWGTMVHHWKETGIIRAGADKRTGTAFTKAVKLSGVDRHDLWPPGGTHETTMAVWVGAGDVLADNTEGGCGRLGASAEAVIGLPGWISGHSDFHWWLLDGLLWVDDLKTSKLYPNPDEQWPGHVPHLAVGENRFPELPTSVQLGFYALALSLALDYKGDVVASITHWPRLPLARRHALPERIWHTYSSGELLSLHDRLRVLDSERRHNELVVTDGSGTLKLTPGAHCRFCPSRNFCLAAETFE